MCIRDRDGSINEIYRRLNSGEMRLSDFLQPGFAVVSDWIQKGYVDAGKTLVTSKTKDDLEQFSKGEAPFMLTGAWAAGTVRSKADFRFEIRPYPILEDGSVLVINTDTRLSVNRRGKHVEQAVDFVRFFLQEENLDRFVSNQSSFTPIKNGKNSNRAEILPLYEALQNDRYVIGANEKLDLPIWQISKEATQMLLRGESWDKISARIDNSPEK